MAPLTKDTLEIANSASESTVSQSANPVQPASGHLRSDAVSLEVSVRVHGSKVKDVAPGAAPHTEPFEEQTITMIIFPQGAVLKMLTGVNVGQMLVLTNLKSRQDAICRVVKVRPNANLAAYVEVEFTNHQPGYWGAQFPSDTPAATINAAPPPVDAPPAVLEPQKPAQDIFQHLAPPTSTMAFRPLIASPVINEPKPPVVASPASIPPANPAPSFISIGSQEEVQPAASSTATIAPGSARENAHENFTPPAPKAPTPAEIPAVAPASLSMSESQVDEGYASANLGVTQDISDVHEQELLVAAAASASRETSYSTFGSFAGGATLAAARSTSSESFGAGFDPEAGATGNFSAAPKQNWVLLGACAALLIVCLGGGFFYFRGPSANDTPSITTPRVATPSQTAPATLPIAPANDDPTASVTNAPVTPVAEVNAGAPPPATVKATNAAKPPKATPITPAPPPAPTKLAAPKVTPDMMSQALNAHPRSSKRAHTGSAEAPALEDDSAAAPQPSNALPGISASNNIAALPPPAIQPEGPVQIGGNVKEPRLVSSVMPVYPMGAMKAGISGDVVIQATIDNNGKVAEMHVVAGPSLLRQAALDALRRWKYEPSTLDGQPVAVQMQVTIKFRR